MILTAAVALRLTPVPFHWPSAAIAITLAFPVLAGAHIAGEKWKRKKADQIAEISAVKESLLAPAPLDEKLDGIAKGLVRILGADFARVWVVRKGDICDTSCVHRAICPRPGFCLHLVASAGRYTHLDGAHQRVPLGFFKIGGIATGDSSQLLSNDVQNDPRIHDREWARNLGLKSFAGYRIMNEAQQAAGVLAMFSKRAVSPSDQDLLVDLANVVSHVLVSSAAGEALREAYQLLEGRVRQRTQELAVANMALKTEIEQRKSAENYLRRAHTESESLLASLSSFLIGIDTMWCIRRWNAAAASMFGVSDDEVLGKPAPECGLGWDWALIREHVMMAAKRRETVRIPELVIARENDRARVVMATIDAVSDEDGEIEGYIILGTDITAQKDLHAQLVHSQKLESIGQLAAGIAHEINTPIQYVGDNLEFLRATFSALRTFIDELAALAVAQGADTRVAELRNRLDLDFVLTEIPSAVEQSLEGVSRVAHIVRAMKEFSHPGAAAKTQIDINRAIENTVTVARNRWKYVADLHMHLDPNMPSVPCFPDEFNQAILNIVLNAADAISEKTQQSEPTKGVITITTQCVEGYAEIRIEDTGIGIASGIRHRIFDPFFTTKPVGKGTGQGLAIVYNVIVEKHGGTIAVESEDGNGCAFILRIPLAERAIPEKVGTPGGGI